MNQHISTICRRKVVSGPVEGATLGNIIIQAIAMGRVRDLHEGRKLVKKSFPLKTYLPLQEPEHLAGRYAHFLNFKKR